jgi:hypothetical protein
MEKINPGEYYSLLHAQEFTGIKSRQRLAKYIEEGKLIAITVGAGANRRYAIRGDFLQTFIEKMKDGTLASDKYSKKEVEMLLSLAVQYCQVRNITTLEEMIKNINELNK